jgi:hypothetical protein
VQQTKNCSPDGQGPTIPFQGSLLWLKDLPPFPIMPYWMPSLYHRDLYGTLKIQIIAVLLAIYQSKNPKKQNY